MEKLFPEIPALFPHKSMIAENRIVSNRIFNLKHAPKMNLGDRSSDACTRPMCYFF
jgi:hypothetical protein